MARRREGRASSYHGVSLDLEVMIKAWLQWGHVLQPEGARGQQSRPLPPMAELSVIPSLGSPCDEHIPSSCLVRVFGDEVDSHLQILSDDFFSSNLDSPHARPRASSPHDIVVMRFLRLRADTSGGDRRSTQIRSESESRLK